MDQPGLIYLDEVTFKVGKPVTQGIQVNIVSGSLLPVYHIGDVLQVSLAASRKAQSQILSGTVVVPYEGYGIALPGNNLIGVYRGIGSRLACRKFFSQDDYAVVVIGFEFRDLPVILPFNFMKAYHLILLLKFFKLCLWEGVEVDLLKVWMDLYDLFHVVLQADLLYLDIALSKCTLQIDEVF